LPERAKVAVLISGSGTNMAALLYASRAEDCPYEVVLVAANDPEAKGLALAAAEGVPTFALSHKGMARADHDRAMDAAIRASGADYLALAGYMRILTPEFVSGWEGRMLNIHPSLLPKYPGLHTHDRALEAGDSHGGCTVHLVTAELDDGPMLGQTAVAILPGDTAESLAARVLIAEHQLYSRCLAKLVTEYRSPDRLVAKVRELALALPESDEIVSHGMPCFGVIKGKKFAYVSHDHHGDGKLAVLVKISGLDEQQQLIEMDEARYYRPAYFGNDWIAIRIDLGDTDWVTIGDWLARSWRAVAPKKLTGLMDAASDF
jgi:formyltetrahydrofolate-dependent phosphoribosylglycinamide formyltransferase